MRRIGWLWLMLLGACGYVPLHVHAPFGAHRVAIAPFVETPNVGIDALLAGHLAAALAAGGVAVVADAARAEAVLGGEVQIVARPGTTLQAVQIYNLEATLQATWRDTAGCVRWRCNVAAKESFLPQGTFGQSQPLATETQRRMALARLAENLAQRVAEALAHAQLPVPPAADPAAQGAAPPP